MSKSATVPIAREGDIQIVRLPEAFHLPGSEVRVRQCDGGSLVLEPIRPRMSREEIRARLAELDRYRDIPFMENGREQPPMPDDDDLPAFD